MIGTEDTQSDIERDRDFSEDKPTVQVNQEPRDIELDSASPAMTAERVKDFVEQALDDAEPFVDKVLAKTESLAHEAHEKADALSEKVKEKVEPLLEKAGEKAESLLEKTGGNSGKASTA